MLRFIDLMQELTSHEYKDKVKQKHKYSAFIENEYIKETLKHDATRV